MIRAQHVIFPGILAGSLLLIFITNMITNPQIALANNELSPAAVTDAVTGAVSDTISEVVTNVIPAVFPKAAPTEQAAAKKKAVKKVEKQPEPQPAAQPSSDCSLSPNYPDTVQQWCGFIEKHARENGIPAGLLAAMMQQESGGNPWAISSSGAVGLMQIMPRDGIAASFMCGGGPCFAGRPSAQELYDPEFNISYAARMMSGLANRYGGDIREALRSYGPMDVGYSYADTVLQIFNNR